MQCLPIRTRLVKPPKDNIYEILDTCLPQLKEEDIILITSKIVSIHQGRCVEKVTTNLSDLVEKESRIIVQRAKSPITVTNNAIILAAGVDPFMEYYVLLPDKPNQFAREVRSYLLKKYDLKKLGVIISDSRSQPLRRGLMCYSLGFAGINPLSDNSKFGDFAHWSSNAVDALTAYAGLYLGESSQKHNLTPIVLIRGADRIEFTENNMEDKFYVDGKDDFYYQLYSKRKIKHEDTNN